MKYILSFALLLSASLLHASYDVILNTRLIECMVADSDSVRIDVNAPVQSFGDRLYQQGIQIGRFDKRTSVENLQMTIRIQIYNMEGKAVAEAVAYGVNASFAVNIFGSNEKLSMNCRFDHEAEDIAQRLRLMQKL